MFLNLCIGLAYLLWKHMSTLTKHRSNGITPNLLKENSFSSQLPRAWIRIRDVEKSWIRIRTEQIRMHINRIRIHMNYKTM